MVRIPPTVSAFLDRLLTVTEYAQLEGISRVQAHRRIKQGVVGEVVIRGHIFIVLPSPTSSKE